MAHTRDFTAVAVYDDTAEANAAAADLKEAGFQPDDIYISSETPGTSESNYPTYREHGITGWFKSLFGVHEHPHRTDYQNAVAAGKIIVSVDTVDTDFNRASEILARHSPVDIYADDYATGRGIGTPNTDSAVLESGPIDVLREQTLGLRPPSEPVTIQEPMRRVGDRIIKRGGVTVYPRSHRAAC